MQNFRNLKIWQNGMEIVKKSYQLVALLPNEEKYGLRSQITRSAVSIPSNIAEGCSRNSNKDFSRFLQIALGSAFELETQLTIVEDLNIATTDLIEEIKLMLNEEQKMITGFMQKLSR